MVLQAEGRPKGERLMLNYGFSEKLIRSALVLARMLAGAGVGISAGGFLVYTVFLYKAHRAPDLFFTWLKFGGALLACAAVFALCGMLIDGLHRSVNGTRDPRLSRILGL